MDRKLDFDEVLEAIGPRGKFQVITTLLLWLATGAGGLAVVVFAFTGFMPDYRCPIAECGETKDSNYYLDAEQQVYPKYIEEAFGVNASKELGECRLHVAVDDARPISLATAKTCEEFVRDIGQGNVTTCQTSDLIFDNSVVNTSLVSYFGFACQRHFYRSIYNALYMCGLLVGSFVIGIISDTFGRMKALMLSIGLVCFVGTLSTFSPWPELYGFLRFVTGMGGMGCYMVAYIISLENTTPQNAVKFTTLCGLGFIFGELILLLEAFLIRDWYTLNIVAHILVVVSFLLWFLVPESARWLLSNGKITEAKKIIKLMARRNNTSEPEHLYELQSKTQPSNCEAIEHPKLLDVFRPSTIAFRTLNMMYQWASVTMGYYGLTFAMTELSGNPYRNFLFGTVVEFVGTAFQYALTDIIGRKRMLIFVQLLAGISCVIAGLLMGNKQLEILQTCLALLGKFSATAGFGMVYLFTAELYPTTIRNTALGCCSTAARVGGIISLLLGGLSQIWPPFPMVIMGSVATLAGLLAFFFPETTGEPLPETMEEAVNIGVGSSFKPFKNWKKAVTCK